MAQITLPSSTKDCLNDNVHHLAVFCKVLHINGILFNFYYRRSVDSLVEMARTCN